LLTLSVADALSKLNIFDDTPSFFTSPSFQQAPILKNKLDLEMRQSHLPDLVNGKLRIFENKENSLIYFFSFFGTAKKYQRA